MALLIGVLDAALTVAIPLGIMVVVALLVWAVDDGARPAWTGFYDAAASVWLLGHGVDIRFALGGGTSFTATIAALGPAMITALAAVRAGGRAARTDAPVTGVVAGVVTIALAASVVLLTASTDAARPSPAQAILWPAAIYAGGALLGMVRVRRDDLHAEAIAENSVSDGSLSDGLRAGAGAVAIVLGVAALAVTVLVAAGLSTVVGLYESLHAGAVGGLALTLAQLALLPTVVVWAAAWFIGPGFAVGAGSSVSPLGTHLGPVPSLPLLGALPTGASSFVWLLVPVLAGFAAGLLTARRSTRPPHGARILLVGGIAGVAGGLVIGLLSAVASGAAGPGRLGITGPDALLVGICVGIEIGIPAMLGLASGGRSDGRIDDATRYLTPADSTRERSRPGR